MTNCCKQAAARSRRHRGGRDDAAIARRLDSARISGMAGIGEGETGVHDVTLGGRVAAAFSA